MTESARAAQREYYRQYREKNREKLREYQAQYRRKNKAKIRQYQRNFWENRANRLIGGTP
ncbi:hypothetical protein H0486_18135 [Lachnospiraceae bacterium MD1]|jgi:hypothetical protein|uniref:Uncharacterized protein n=1 Tax=Variimorphobacter saccharofermentans TaxID=2755051 RepID=A0A839K5Z8_9FIRM|nr:phosphatase [Variimorphobacter saccharofermentans]MBB2184778.1 hypothetical protein [Variimorphobacter saccharofermentans]